jgi:hypothetical protein
VPTMKRERISAKDDSNCIYFGHNKLKSLTGATYFDVVGHVDSDSDRRFGKIRVEAETPQRGLGINDIHN